MSRMRHARRATLVGASALALGACTSFTLTRRRPPTLHRLTPKTTFDPNQDWLGVRVLVEPPSAASGLNTARIALRPDPTGLDYFADALWVEVVPIMVQVLLAESLDASGAFDVLSPESVGLRPDFILRAFIREFQADYDDGLSNPPLATVQLQTRLLRMPRRESMATFSAKELVRAEGTSLDFIITAFDEALGRVQRRIVEWMIEEATNEATDI